MEAWILHIEEDSVDDEDKAIKNIAEYYTAWSTEKQATKAACKHIQDIYFWFMPTTLLTAAIALIEVEKWQEAINLINEYSKAEIVGRPGYSSNFHYRKFTIKITKSTFLGNVFE